MASFIADKEWLVDYVIQFLKATTWSMPLEDFIEQHCAVFDLATPEENKLEYTTLHDEYKNMIESVLVAHLLEVDATADDFAMILEACCCGDDKLAPVAAQLASVDDFYAFKKMMVSAHVETFGDPVAKIQEQQELAEQRAAAECQEAQAQQDEEDRVKKQKVMELLQQLYARTAVPVSPAPALAVAAAALEVAASPAPDDDLLPDMPEMVLNHAAASSGTASNHIPLPKISSSRIAAIIASAAQSKTGGDEKAAIFAMAGRSPLTNASSRFGA